jgi:hypothetical protein
MRATLEEDVRSALEAAGIQVRLVAAETDVPDASLWALGPKHKQVLALTRKAAAQLENSERERIPRLYIAEHISERLGERWIREGRQFADAAGNAHLDMAGLKVRILGLRARHSSTSERTVHEEREWRGAGLRTLFHLLSAPDWIHRPIREIGALCGSTPRTVTLLLDDLERSGHLIRVERSERRFHPDPALLDRWLQEYGRKLRPRLALGRFTASDPDRLRDLDLTSGRTAWGGESAAARLGADLQPGIDTLYVRGSVKQLIRDARLRPDPEGRIELRKAFWSPELRGATPETTPPLLVVADLTAVRDARCYDAAKTIRERYLPWT